MKSKYMEGQERIPSGCAVSGIFSRGGQAVNGGKIVEMMTVMHDRSNGLGGGFAAYGIYPEYKEFYAFHVFYLKDGAKESCERLINENFEVAYHSPIPTRKVKEITNEPIIQRYFAKPKNFKLEEAQEDERQFVLSFVNKVHKMVDGAYVFSSGKNMGTFKAEGFPEDVGRFYRLEEYDGYCFTGHGRYPTNTPGWWGGAHPFSLLDYSVVHNGEISSYDTNRRSVEMYGYNCNLLTDTEVITYMIDYLNRRVGLTMKEVAAVIAAPFWQTIEQMDEERKKAHTYLRTVFADQLITGPFSVLVGFDGGLMALNDRLKLRSMVVAEKGDMVYIASEECAIRVVEPDAENLFRPKGGEAVIVKLREKIEDEVKL